AAEEEAAGQPREAGPRRQRRLGMEYHRGLLPGNQFQRPRGIALAVRAGKDDDGGFHGAGGTRFKANWQGRSAAASLSCGYPRRPKAADPKSALRPERRNPWRGRARPRAKKAPARSRA